MMKVQCPICAKAMSGSSPREWPDFPFCSDKCRLIDLGRWLGESYRIAAPDLGGDDEGDLDEEPIPPA